MRLGLILPKRLKKILFQYPNLLLVTHNLSAVQTLENVEVCAGSRILNIDHAVKCFWQSLQINFNLIKSLLNMAKISYKQAYYLQACFHHQRHYIIYWWSFQVLLLSIKTKDQLNDEDAVVALYSVVMRRFSRCR